MSNKHFRPTLRTILTLLLCVAANNTVLANTVVTVTDNSGQKIEDAVVYAEPEFALPATKAEPAVIEQKN